MRGIPAGVALLLLGLACPTPGLAQLVRGQVTAGDPPRGVPGVIVQLTDSAGAVVSRALSREDGSFSLAASRSGRYAVRTLRLGFQPTIAGPFDIPSDGRTGLRVALREVPVSIAGVRVSGRNECVLASAREGGDVLAVWEEARKALLASLVAQGESRFGVTTTTYARVLSPIARRVVRQSVEQRVGASSRPFASTMRPESYALLGYRQLDADGATFYAPDAETLLSEAFAEGHCLRIARDPRPGEVGVSFEPKSGAPRFRADGQRFVDVMGTLWLDATTARLRRAAISYTNLESDLATKGTSARIEFEYLPTDVPVVTEWDITIPRLEAKGAGRGAPLQVADIWISGGQLAEARRGAAVVWRARTATVRGVVRSNRAPVRDASVRLGGSTYSVRVDSTGAFEIPNVLPGRYEMFVGRWLAEQLGVADREAGEVTAGAGETVAVALEADTERDIVRRGCREHGEAPTAVVGVVRGLPAGLRRPWIGAFWIDSATYVAGTLAYAQKGQVTRADEEGRFVLCGVVRGQAIQLFAARDSLIRLRVAGDTVRLAPDSDVVHVTLAHQAGMGITRVRGRVTTAAGAPVGGAAVGLLGGTETQTDSLGRFALDAPEGMSILRTRKVGYQVSIKTLSIVNDAPVDLTVALERPATRLAGVIVRADSSSGFGGNDRGFENRRATGQGNYLTEKDVASFPGARLEDLFRTVAGVQVDSAGVPKVNRGRVSILSDNCQQGMQIVIDGAFIQPDYSLRALPLKSIRSIEVYHGPSTTPFEFRSTRTPCGTIVIWTK